MLDLAVLEQMANADAYARLRLGIGLYGWQERVLRAMTRRGARVAVRTCNESGKTSTLVTSLVLWHMEAFVGSLTITTSGSYRQIKDQLYPHLQNWAGRLGDGWEFGDGWGRHHRTGSRLVSFSTDNPGKAEGWHEPPRMPGDIAGHNNPLAGFGLADAEWSGMAANAAKSSLLLMIDEAKTPPIEIYEAFERCHATRWINLSSPGPSYGPFYDCFHRDAGRWQGFKVAASDCPHLWDSPEKRAELEEQITSLRPELVQSMIYGEFMPEGAGQVFDMGRVDDAMNGKVETVGLGRYRRAALDISAGGDEQVLAVCDGNRAWIEWAGFEKDDHRLVEIVCLRLKRLGIAPEDCFADDGGLGKIVINQFEREGFYLRRFDFAAKPNNPSMYRNARAEAYFKLADLVRLGQAVLPQDDTLREELAFCRYEVDSSPLQLVAKKKLPRSPNRSDAVAMLFYELYDFKKLTEKEDDGADIVSPTRRRREREEYAGSVWEE
jgi:hypothetical protein